MKNYRINIMLLLLIGVLACEPNELISPIPPTEAATIEPLVGGPDQPNQVFIDLSKSNTTVVPRTTWDLGFSNDGDFRVILNYSTYMVARPTSETDLTMVTSSLVTDDFKAEMVVAPEGSINWIDNPNGDLNETAIAEISTNDDENLIYVINRGHTEAGEQFNERGFIKIKVTRTNNEYVVTYGGIDATSFTTINISKDQNLNFTFLNFDNGLVDVEPDKTLWDIAFTTSSNYFFDHATSTTVPYQFKDIAITNKGNVKVSAIEVTTEINFDNFTLSDVAGIELEDSRFGIGSSWRLFEFATFSYVLNTEIFYVIEDTEGNYYKLVFSRMYCIESGCAGERGYPEFSYQLLN